MIETYSPLSPRVKTYQVVSELIPEFAKSENPLFSKFLEQYYISQDYQGGPADIAENIDAYIKVDNLTTDVIRGTTTLVGTISSTDTTVNVDSTDGYPQKYGLFKIDDEICGYTGLTTNSFTGVWRGFSGISTFRKQNDPSALDWQKTVAGVHTTGANVVNLSSLFLKEFYKNLKAMYTPGLEGVTLSPQLDVNNFIKEARSLYEAKGTRASFKILFKALFGVDPKINDLEKYLIKPSFANYLRRKTVSVQLISGDPSKLVGQTLFQENDPTNPKLNPASGPISEVSNIREDYYKLSLFTGFEERGLTDGTFIVPGRSNNIGKIGIGASVITVDSTIGFSSTGTIKVGEIGTSFYQTFTYGSKSINQFFDVDPPVSIEIPNNSTVSTFNVVHGFEDGDSSKKVEMRLTGVLSDFITSRSLRNLKSTSDIKVKNLGRYISNPNINKTYDEVFFNTWIYNTSARYQIDVWAGSNFTLVGNIEKSSLKAGDRIEILRRNSEVVVAPSLIVASIDASAKSISLDGTIPSLDLSLDYDIRRLQDKVKSSIVPVKGGQDQLLTDINNAYIVDESKSESGKREAYVASSSLPSYTIKADRIHAVLVNPSLAGGNWSGYNSVENKYSIISFASDVPFETGDEIIYAPDPGTEVIGGLSSPSYFVEVQGSKNQIKLYASRSFIKANLPTYFTAPSTTVGRHDFILATQGTRNIFPARPIKRFILEQQLKSGKEGQTTSEITVDGNTAMLINGIEVLNYKGADQIFYGPVQNLNVINSGIDYDVQAAPNIDIIDATVSVANTAGAVPVLSGIVSSILIDPFDYDLDKVISVEIYGGNGFGAVGRALVEERFRQVYFNGISTNLGGDVSSTYNTFNLDKDHNFLSGDRIVYNNNGGSNIGVATTGSPSDTLTLYSGQDYYVNVWDSKVFSLHNNKNDAVVGINTILIDENAAISNSGLHIFRTFDKKRTISRIAVEEVGENYSNRNLFVKSVGINTFNDSIEFIDHGLTDGDVLEYDNGVNPIITGLSTTKQYQVLKIDKDKFRLAEAGNKGDREPTETNYNNRQNIFLDSTGIGTGYHHFKYPPIVCKVNVLTKDQQQRELTATPVVRGNIKEILMYENGANYGSTILNFPNPPIINIPFGKLGQIGLIISNGTITDAYVANGGSGYVGPPDLNVVSAATTSTGAILRSVVNNAGKIVDVKVISGGVGYADTNTSVNVVPVGSEFRAEASVRPLTVNQAYRLDQSEMDYLQPIGDGLAVNVVGYGNSVRNFFGDDGSGHSPIIGWAYDGNPVYGPYGLVDTNNIQSNVKKMQSSYEISAASIENRPPASQFPYGYFIDDYVYTGNGDLDEHNGRYTKTPDFPQGVYGYFATVDLLNDPQFPFFIGNTYRSSAIEENTVKGKLIDQTNFDFAGSSLVRNTQPYGLFGDGISYDYVFQPYTTNNQVSNPSNLLEGSVESISILNSGSGYSLGDKLVFDETGTNGVGVDAEVQKLYGEPINRISSSVITLSDLPIRHTRQGIVFKAAPSHQFTGSDTVRVTGISTYIKNLEGFKKIAVASYGSSLRDNGYTGIITDLKVDFVPPNIAVGDSIGIGTETARILSFYPNEKIVRIERYAGFTTAATGAAVTFFTSEFTVPIEVDPFESSFQNLIYFNPKDAVGVGTTVGISTTVNVSLNGVTKERSILAQSIHLPNHRLRDNDKITFDKRGNTDLFVTDSISPYTAPSALSGDYYVINKTADTIGLKTNTSGPDLFFTTTGDDKANYSFVTNYKQETATVRRSQVEVETTKAHGLQENDRFDLVVKTGLTTGIGTSTRATVKLIDGYTIINPLEIPTSGVNTTSSVFTIQDHALDTGFKVLLYGAGGDSSKLPGGLEQRPYFVYKIDDDKFQLTNTEKQLYSNPPEIVGFNSTGFSGQSVNPINPPVTVFRNNNIIFDLNDTSLSGANLKFFYDKNTFNEYVGTGLTSNLEVVGFGTVGVGTTNSADMPYKQINYSESLKNTIYYAIEKGGYITTSETDVLYGNQIKYTDSGYNGKQYIATGVGATTFTANIVAEPEKSHYTPEDCEDLYYTHIGAAATGGVAKIKINNGGFGYQKLPAVTSIGSSGISAELELFGNNINLLDEVSVPTDVYGYPADNTLKPDAFLPRIIQIKNASKVLSASVTFGGKSYLNAPAIAVYDKTTGEIVNNGLLTAELSDSAVNKVNVVVEPRGLTGNDYGLAPLRNSNGISIIEAFSDVGVLTCRITTPILGYDTEPFTAGEIVYLEGIEYTPGSGDGFNSGDYKFIDFEIAAYNSATNPREVTFTYTGLTTNPGIGATVVPGFGQIVKSGDLARFSALKSFSEFRINEPLRRNNDLFTDLVMTDLDTNTGIMVVSGSLNLEIDDKLTGTNSGDVCEVQAITEFDGYFDISSTIDTNVGWSDNIGLIGDNNQFLPDNDYYQNMSYAIESEKTYEDLITYVNDIVHPAGFKNFANTQILTKGDAGESFIPAADAGGLVLDFISDPLRIDAIYNYDISRDANSANNLSKFLELKQTRLADFILCKTNRVLLHDDISPQFISNESNDLSDSRVIAATLAGRYFSRYLVQTTHDAQDPNKNHYQLNELILITSGGDTYLVQKSALNNTNQVGLSTGYGEFFAQYNVNNGQTQVRIKPYEPFDTNYDIKAMQQGFADAVGTGQDSLGNAEVRSVNINVGTATTTEIVGIATANLVGTHAHIAVIDKSTNKVDYHELVLQHDGIDTYLTEVASFNNRQSLGGISSPQFMGTFTSSIDSGVVKLEYIHSEAQSIDLRCKFMSFNPVGYGTTSVKYFNIPFTPEGSERSGRIIVGSSATTGIATVCGITSFTDLSFKSTVSVGYGNTQTFHQIYVLSDPNKADTFLSQGPIAAIGTTTGIGTFGAEFSGSNVNLEFYPDAGVTGIVSIFSYNEVIYRQNDPNGLLAGIGSFNYGQVFENVTQNTYLGINNRNIRKFGLKYQNTPIYQRAFNPENANEIDKGTGLITLKHFFSNTEKVTYKPDSNIVGLAASALEYSTGYGSTALPSTCYIVKSNNNQFYISTSITDARVGRAVTFAQGTGQGNLHKFTMDKRDSKSIIALNGLVQKPLSHTSITYDLDVAVNGFVTCFALSGLSTITSGDLLRIDDEYSIVQTVGFGSTTTGPITGIGTWSLVEVERGTVGSAATVHSAGSTARIYRGAFQIVDSDVYFTNAPLGGDLGMIDPGNLPYPRASFGGRTYLRQDYDTNQIFDDNSDGFDGLENIFPLTSTGVAVTGIGSTGGNGVLFINSMFQAPFGENNEGVANFKIIEQSLGGIASVNYTGITSFGYTDLIIDVDDVNQNQLPRGGIIVSVASTPGLGYAPFKGAKVHVTTGAAGAITGITGVSTTDNFIDVESAIYDTRTGFVTVSTAQNHRLGVEDFAKLVGLEFTCNGYQHTYISDAGADAALEVGGDYPHQWVTSSSNSVEFGGNYAHQWVSANSNAVNVQSGAEAGNQKSPSSGTYDPATGVLSLTFGGNHNMSSSDTITLDNNSLFFKCARDNYATTHSYPRSGSDSISGVTTAVTVTSPTSFTINVGTTPLQYFTPTDGDYNGATGNLTLTIGSAGVAAAVANNLKVGIITSSLTFRCARDGYATDHVYPRTTDPINNTVVTIGSTTATTITLPVGISTNVRYGVYSAEYSGATGIIRISTGSSASQDANQPFAVGDLVGIGTNTLKFTCAKDNHATVHTYPRSSDPAHNVMLSIASTSQTEFTVDVGKSGLGYGNTIGITSFVYDHISGIATVLTTSPHGFSDPSMVGITTGGLTFTCEMDGYRTNHTYPRATDPANNKFLEIRNVTKDEFDVNVGISTQVTYTPTNAVYDPIAGIMTMTVGSHNIMSGTSIKIAQESLNFKCAMDGLSTTKSYPRITDPYFDRAISVASTTATGIAVTIGTSPTVNYSITTATYNPSTGIITATIGQHPLKDGTSIKLKEGSLIFRCATDGYASTSTYPRSTIDTQTINGATYDANVGIMTVTVVPGGRLIHDGDFVRFDNDSIRFTCDMDGGTSTESYPRSTDPYSGKWMPITGIGTTSFAVQVGKSPIQPFGITSAIYDPTAGIVTVTIPDHTLMTGSSIRLSPESFAFRCGLDTYQSVHRYPRTTDTVGYNTAVSIASTTASTISFQILPSQPSSNVSTHHHVPNDKLSPIGATYDPVVGIMTVTANAHGLSNGDYVKFDDGSVSFTCTRDNNQSVHAYPRTKDPYHNNWIKVSNVTTNTFRVNGMKSYDNATHTFVSGVPNSITRSVIVSGGAYNHTFVSAGVGSMDQKRDRTYDQPVEITAGYTLDTAEDAIYDPVAGIMTVTATAHGMMNGDYVLFENNSIALKCSQDNYATVHTYPRLTDPISGDWVAVASTTVNSFAVDVGKTNTGDQYAHQFAGAVENGIRKQNGTITFQAGIATDTSEHRFDIMGGHQASNAVITGGNYAHTFVNALSGAVKTGGGFNHRLVSAASSTLYIDAWTGAALTVSNAVYNPETGIVRFTAKDHGLVAPENFKFEGIGVTCQYGTKTYPSGVQGYHYTIRSVGTTTSFTTFVGYSTVQHDYTGGGSVQVGVTSNKFPSFDEAYPVAGIISARSFKVNVGPNTITHSYVGGGQVAQYHPLTYGSGYQTGLGTIGIAVSSPTGGVGAQINAVVGAGGSLIFSIGAGGTGYTGEYDCVHAPEPDGENMPIVGISRIGLGNTTITGVGCSISVQIAGVSTATGIGSTFAEVTEWEFTKKGYGFKRGDKFTVAGLSTDPGAGDNYKDFEIEVIEVFTDQVASWQFGNIDYLDNIKPNQTGDQKRFPLYYQSQLVSFEIDRNDQDSREIDLSTVLLVFINGVIQEPNVNYIFTGGSVIEFSSAPTVNDNVVIFFYRGTIGQDSYIFDINETIKIGDTLRLDKSAEMQLNKVVKDQSNFAQIEDRIIKRIDSAATVETPFYQGPGISNDNYKPLTWTKQKKDLFVDGSLVSKARDSMEAQINPLGHIIGVLTTTDAEIFVDTVGNFRDTDGLLTESFGLLAIAPVGFGTTAATGVNFENIGGIEPLVADVQGYIGVVTGIGTTAGIGTDLALELLIDNQEYVNSGGDATGLSTNYPFRLYGTGINTVGTAITSIDSHDTDIVSISTHYGDNIYYASAISFRNNGRQGIITANIASYSDTSDMVGVGSTAFAYAHFTWGRFANVNRAAAPISLDVKGLSYDNELSKFPLVLRRGVGHRGTGALPKLL